MSGRLAAAEVLSRLLRGSLVSMSASAAVAATESVPDSTPGAARASSGGRTLACVCGQPLCRATDDNCHAVPDPSKGGFVWLALLLSDGKLESAKQRLIAGSKLRVSRIHFSEEALNVGNSGRVRLKQNALPLSIRGSAMTDSEGQRALADLEVPKSRSGSNGSRPGSNGSRPGSQGQRKDRPNRLRTVDPDASAEEAAKLADDLKDHIEARYRAVGADVPWLTSEELRTHLESCVVLPCDVEEARGRFQHVASQTGALCACASCGVQDPSMGYKEVDLSTIGDEHWLVVPEGSVRWLEGLGEVELVGSDGKRRCVRGPRLEWQARVAPSLGGDR